MLADLFQVICEASIILPIRASIASKVYFAGAAKERAEAKGLSSAEWSIRRLLTPTTLAADIRMAFDVGGEVVPAARSPTAEASAK